MLAGAATACIALAAAPAGAQIAPDPAAPAAPSATARPAAAAGSFTALGSTLDAVTLSDLPTSDNLFAVLETTQPAIVSDRFSNGDLNVGAPARVGAFGSSWTQTRFRIGDVDITDPDGSGTPLLFPDLSLWQRITMTTGLTATGEDGAGLAVSLEPKQPAAAWMETGEASMASPTFVQAVSASGPPAIASLHDWRHADLLVSGPLVAGRLGVVGAVSWSRSTQVVRGGPLPVEGRVASGFMHLVFTPAAGDALGTIVWLQQVRDPFPDRLAYGQPAAAEADTSIDLQSTWTHRMPGGTDWRLFGSYTARRQDPGVSAVSPLVVDSLRDGPVPDLAAAGLHRDRRWSLGVHVAPPAPPLFGRHQTLTAGAEVDGERVQTDATFSGLLGELVDGIPARVWQYTSPGIPSSRRATTAAAWVGDHIALASRVVVDAGLRYDAVVGSAAGAVDGVRWGSWLPRATVRWDASRTGGVALFAGYQRSAWQLPLDLLAYGDPAAPVARVFRWDAPPGTTALAPAAVGPLVAMVGPGTGGDPAFTRLDPQLARPTQDKAVVGIEARPRAGLRLRLAGVAARTRQLIGLVDIGVPASSYAVTGLPDPGVDLHSPTLQLLPVYSRLPASFGQDRYLLTNPAGDTSTFIGAEVSVQASIDRLFLLAGATAGRADGLAADPGFLATENDPGVVGDLFTDPNAATYARGRLFGDRAYTIKITGVYRFPADVHLGLIARYQDGQPFARLVVVPGLGQGAEAIRAFPNGASRFSYTTTLDARVRKGFRVDGHRLDLILDAYNLLNRANEVEEVVVSGPAFRTPTAVQPPRAFDIGVQVSF